MRMVAQGWAFLTRRGEDEEACLSLRFCLAAPGEREAREVANVLRVQSDYETRLLRSRRGWLRRKAWMVELSLPPSMLSLDDLNTRSEQVESVAKQGQCRLEEWGARMLP